MPGTRVTCEDINTGESESIVIENDYLLVTDGNHYLHGVTKHANGTHIITVKKQKD